MQLYREICNANVECGRKEDQKVIEMSVLRSLNFVLGSVAKCTRLP